MGDLKAAFLAAKYVYNTCEGGWRSPRDHYLLHNTIKSLSSLFFCWNKSVYWVPLKILEAPLNIESLVTLDVDTQTSVGINELRQPSPFQETRFISDVGNED